VLDLAKLDTHRFSLLREEVDLQRLVDRAYSAYGEEARRRGIDYSRSVSATPVLETDGDRVLQVISNLLANAFRWTPDGGRVGLALTQVDGTVRIAVDDSGPGIPAEERERIFRPFWSRDGHGTGLGLAIANELAAALGGEIELQSEAGKGSRFELILPVRRTRA
jgi:signal transduction histidine kinase